MKRIEIRDHLCAGLDWPPAVLYTRLIFMLFLVLGRAVAETGAFMVQPYGYPCVTQDVRGLLRVR
jgi:hypothetical protein